MFRRSSSIRLMDVAGIRVGVDGSWFLMLFVLIFLLSGSFRSALHSSDTVAYLTTVATVLLFFGSLILHEFGHAIAARRQGIEVTRIELYLFGGLTHMSREPLTPGEDFKVAAAGPLATFLFVLVCLAVDLALVGPSRLVHATELDSTITITPVLLSLSWLLPMNVLILAFNLVPAFPLDGGRIARAAIWRATGDRIRGTRVSARLGQGFALVLVGAGVWLAVSSGLFAGIWLMALGYLLYQSARAALVQTAVSERIEGVRVSDVMDTRPVAVPADAATTQALDEYLLRYQAEWLPVVDGSDHFLGIVRRSRAQAAVDAGAGWTSVSSQLEPDTVELLGVQDDRPLTDLLSREALGRLGAVVAVDGDGILRGIVTSDAVRRALHSLIGFSAR